MGRRPISLVGEVEDLRAAVLRLQAEVTSLKKQGAGATAAAKPALKKKYTKIELGMTREEFDAFLAQHANEYKITGIAANTGVHKSIEQTTINRNQQQTVASQQQTQTQTQTGTGSSLSGTPVNRQVGETNNATNTGTQTNEAVERTVVTGKSETITVGYMVREEYQSGTSKTSFGGSSPVYGTRWVQKGYARVEFTDGVVTNMEMGR